MNLPHQALASYLLLQLFKVYLSWILFTIIKLFICCWRLTPEIISSFEQNQNRRISCSVPLWALLCSFSNLDTLFPGAEFYHLWASAYEKEIRCLSVVTEEVMRKLRLLLS